ncbi:Mobile element protein [Candidatus Enterovibrio escicola]|uniref:Mobile element protein n=1 Tax=Candidatus Enterovibrio escicola TaxID=1927127 RepID=A0A2A5SZQ0_9GAMM|nr:transposase [Candidatus Enterovibrio escacola]PCS21360.1 Mobile element protein [Candidatus Enterovibrio escacola]
MRRALVFLCAYLTHNQTKPSGIAFVDSTKLQIYHNLRIPRYPVFDGVTEQGNGMMGGLYGFKLHFVIN